MRPIVIRKEVFSLKYGKNESYYVQSSLWHRATQDVVGLLVMKLFESFAFLSTLRVDEEFHNHGWGTKLMEAAERDAKDRCLRRMELHECLDDPKRTFYRRLGYTYIYQNVMQKNL